MNKIGILTFHWADDLGGMLQAYALKTTLGKLGFSADLVPYYRNEFVGRYWLWPYASYSDDTCGFIGKRQFKKFVNNIKHPVFFFTKRRNMKRFRKQYLCRSGNTSRINRLHLTDYDNIVIGSDQVWNSDLTVGVDKVYWGSFEKKAGAKIVTYAASMGKDRFSDSHRKKIAEYIDNLDVISVRESTSIPLLKQFTSKNIEEMPDPTLLCSKETWQELISRGRSPLHGEKYIVLHSTEYNENMLGLAHKLQEETGFRLVDIREDYPNGPLEYLSIMSEAQYIITNSFHGTVFAILLEKQFVSFSHSRRNARLQILMENVGLPERLSTEHTIEDIYSPVDWKAVNSRVGSLREKGISFLKENLT